VESLGYGWHISMIPCDNSYVRLAKKQHIKYFQRFLSLLPASLVSYDSTRLTIAFFAISGLDILNALDVLDDKKKEHIIDWIYRLQVVPDGSRKENLYMVEKYWCLSMKTHQLQCNKMLRNLYAIHIQ
jgi:prenyltransferase beta subunit